jgi:RNA polymerase sigma-70 factor (ECF subfamily)
MGEPLDEAALLGRARQGDTKAFDELITRHRERIYMHAYQMLRSEDDAVDIAQETFIRAWKSLARFDGKASFSSWLYRIATNATIDLCRRRKSHPEVEMEDGAMKVDPASHTTPHLGEVPGASVDRTEIRRRIEAALLELSPEHRAVVVLKEVEDLSYEEIAQRVGCSLGTVMSRLHYARKHLQTLLRDLHEEF